MFTTTQELEAHSVNLWEMEILFGSDYEFYAFAHDITLKTGMIVFDVIQKPNSIKIELLDR